MRTLARSARSSRKKSPLFNRALLQTSRLRTFALLRSKIGAGGRSRYSRSSYVETKIRECTISKDGRTFSKEGLSFTFRDINGHKLTVTAAGSYCLNYPRDLLITHFDLLRWLPPRDCRCGEERVLFPDKGRLDLRIPELRSSRRKELLGNKIAGCSRAFIFLFLLSLSLSFSLLSLGPAVYFTCDLKNKRFD